MDFFIFLYRYNFLIQNKYKIKYKKQKHVTLQHPKIVILNILMYVQGGRARLPCPILADHMVYTVLWYKAQAQGGEPFYT